jgi:hypothetical protein
MLFRVEDEVEIMTWPVKDFRLTCSYLTEPDAIMGPFRCGMLATSFVADPSDGRQRFRCEGHQGLVSGAQTGKILRETTLRRETRKVYARPVLVSLLRGYDFEAARNNSLPLRVYRAVMWGYHARLMIRRVQRSRKLSRLQGLPSSWAPSLPPRPMASYNERERFVRRFVH